MVDRYRDRGDEGWDRGRDRGYDRDFDRYDRGREFAGDFRDFGRNDVPGGAGWGPRRPYAGGEPLDRDYAVAYDRHDDRSDRWRGGGRDEVNDLGTGRGFDDQRPRQSFRGRGPKNYRRSDERLRELVSERLEDHEAIDASDMEVAVSDGVVTLTGSVDSRRTKRLAEDVALITPGVLDVQNALKIDRGFFGRMAENIREAVQGE